MRRPTGSTFGRRSAIWNLEQVGDWIWDDRFVVARTLAGWCTGLYSGVIVPGEEIKPYWNTRYSVGSRDGYGYASGGAGLF